MKGSYHAFMSKKKSADRLTVQRLREVMDYDPGTGKFVWKRRGGRCLRAGTPAGCHTVNGYTYIRVDGIHYPASRLAWLYVHGVLPERILRFKDGNKLNCAIDNLLYPEGPHTDDTQEYRRYHRRAFAKSIKNRSLKIGFGIDLGEYQQLFVAQKGVCAICCKPERSMVWGKTRWLAVDHCHETGVVRGLLCYACNTSLGKMGDDPSRLRAAAEYIEKARETPAEDGNVIRLIPRKAG